MTRRSAPLHRMILWSTAAIMALMPIAAAQAKRPLPPTPVAPDYRSGDAWLAFPGRDGIERSTPPGFAAVDEKRASADVFFIHPTTYRGNDVENAPYVRSAKSEELNGAVLLGQVSVFNGCCRLYAPRYRQTSVAALNRPAASDLAYSDVAAAFHYYLKHHNNGRPFIIASHSQGTQHAAILLQREILGKPLQSRLVAAYLIGGYVPDSFAQIGLPICDTPGQTGCVISYNASKQGARLARMVIENKRYWWQGKMIDRDQAPAICVNPLGVSPTDSSTAAANLGSLPFPKMPYPERAAPLPALVPSLTGATCRDGMLEVSLRSPIPAGFSDKLTVLAGSYHLNDYGLFYANLRGDAIGRVDAWKAAQQRR